MQALHGISRSIHTAGNCGDWCAVVLQAWIYYPDIFYGAAFCSTFGLAASEIASGLEDRDYGGHWPAFLGDVSDVCGVRAAVR